MKIFCTFLLIIFFLTRVTAQTDEKKITLEDVLHIAHEKSLDAFRAKNIYLASYWEYKSFKARLLPAADLQLSPFTYRRIVQKRYDFERNVDIYRESQTLDSYANLSISQNVAITGGRFYIDSDLGRLENFGADEITTYSATPIRIGLEQPLLGYNALKWQKKISPLKLEKAKQDFVRDQQTINLKGVNLFFELVLANMDWEMAQYDLATSDTLYTIGKKRFEIAGIEKEELLDLELRKFNAKIALAQAEKELSKARFNISSFLGFDERILLSPVLPAVPEGLRIDVNAAVAAALKYNPDILGYQQRTLESQRDLNKTIKENRIDFNLIASYGLNKQAEDLSNAYQNPLDQQLVALNMNIPILDWGRQKGERQMAERSNAVVAIEVKQAKIDFEQQVSLKVMDFNLQEPLVKNSLRASEIAGESFELTKKRFLMGRADVLKLNTSMNARQSAMENYINSIYTYWRNYYEVQQLTLFNFMEERPLSEDFGNIISDQ